MTDSDNIKMTINIGGEHLKLTVPFSRQDAVRDAEKAVSQLFEAWRAKWPSRSDKEILAMVAYQFASFYQELLARQEAAAAIVGECSELLDSLKAGETSPEE